MSSTLPIIDLSNHKAEPMQSFFPNSNTAVPPEVAVIFLDNFNALELSFLQKVSWSWHVVIRTNFHEKILHVREFYLTHYKGQTFQKLTEKEIINISDVETFLKSIPSELVSRFAYLQDVQQRTPLIFAVYANNFTLMRSLIESLPEDEREAYIESKGVSALSLAKHEVTQGNTQFLYLLLPYMKSKIYIMGMLMPREDGEKLLSASTKA